MQLYLEKNSMVPMRDGVRLATDVYRPAEHGRWPVLVARHLYSKDKRFPGEYEHVRLESTLNIRQMVEAGYVVVVQDARGRYASEGDFVPFLLDAEDGADTVAWAAAQPWSTGQVGMYGASYQALAQWQTAIAQPEALRALSVSQSPHAFGIYPYQGGAFQPAFVLPWVLASVAPEEMRRRVEQGRATAADMEALTQAVSELRACIEHLPAIDQPVLCEAAPYYLEWLAHPDYDVYWQATRPNDFYGRVQVPVLTISGWYDVFLRNDLRHYQEMKARGGSELARQQQHLIIGPWAHGNFQMGYPDRRFGEAVSPQAVRALSDFQIRWFDHWLKGIENGIEREKPVHLFVMGVDQWRDEEAWPLPDTQYRPYYLQSQGHANTADGDGLLSPCVSEHAAFDTYCYDPHNPVPTASGIIWGDPGPYDQRAVEERDDVLCYTTPPLEQPLEVTGPVELVVYVSSSARDTDYTGKLVDIYPDGRAVLLTDGILRARYRESFSHPTFLEPGRVYELRLDLGATSNVFQPGHRVRLEVSSSNFPRFDRNSNTGGVIATEREDDFVTAMQRVYHGREYPSRLILPVIERV
uniref:X-Pro dipeptidyl-peptidase n=1 Tax=Thermosporothrix sp. COM3 TaxID=2490863 RepID=A0A455SEL3_9CHLR|nr:X-Pro dipeptidyl-peptidase [Thermosporothrix sp. COM3]